MTEALEVVLIGIAAGVLAGLFGVGGGVLFVPGLVLLGSGQLEAEATSLLAVIGVSLVGAARQRHYGNLDLRAAAVVGGWSVGGVAVGVVVANAVPERGLELAFAGLALFTAFTLVRRALQTEPEGAR